MLPEPYPRWLEFIAWGITPASFASLCGAGIYDIMAALFAGWLVFGLVMLSIRSVRTEEMLEPLAALLIALLGSAIVATGSGLNVPLVVLSGVIAFIPGLSLTMGLRELAARHLISGTARIMDAIMVMFKLYFGAVFGLAVGGLIWSSSQFSPPTTELANWVPYIAVPMLSMSLLPIFKIRLKDAFWCVLSGAIAYMGAAFGHQLFGAGLDGFIGALIVGLYATAYARINNTPTHIVLLPGIVLLVPGSKTYIGLNSLISGQDILANTANGAQVFLSFMAIIAGLIFANVMLPPKRRSKD